MAPRPESGMEGGELVVARIDRPAEEMLLHQITVCIHQFVQATEDDALGLPALFQSRGERATVEGARPAGQIHTFDEERLGCFDSGVLIERRRELIELEKTDVGADPFFVIPRRPIHGSKRLPRLAPLLG